MLTDRVRDALAAQQAGGEEVVGIPPVDLRAGRAHRLPAGAAGLVERGVRELIAVEGVDHFAGPSLDRGRPPA
jgi:hypothetical protein